MKKPRRRLVWVGYPPTAKVFKPYVAAIGQAAVAWNGLHEALRELFHSVSGIENFRTHIAIWHSLRSDRSQRDMLMAVAKVHFDSLDIPETLFDRVKWLHDQANIVARARDDAIHAPLVGNGLHVEPYDLYGHPRARNLVNKDLLTELRWCRDAALSLSDFATRLGIAYSYGDGKSPLPDIPKLPNRGQKNSRPNRVRRARTK